jgi:murein L,D-transpeptidase YafK
MKSASVAALCFTLLAIPCSSGEVKSFRELQWEFPRVRAASKEKDEILRQRFKDKGISYPPRAILLRAFKKEALLELWATDANEKPYLLIHEYGICTSSGVLGPERRLATSKCRKAFTIWTGSTRRAIFT